MARTKPLADLVVRLLGPSMAAQGFTGADVVASWPEIVGERLAEASRPLRVDWPRRRGRDEERPEPATLVVRVEGAFALELQHMAPVVLERINAVYGWRCVGKLVLKQGPVGSRNPVRRPPPPLGEAELRRIAEAVQGLEAPPLRLALERLGRAMASRPAETDAPGMSLSGPPARHS
jgi:hypothetical protein